MPGTSRAGLSSDEVSRRRAADGDNRITAATQRSLVARIWAQLSDPLVLVLVAAAVLTASTGDWPDFTIITLVIVTSTALGLHQERRAEQAIQALAEMTAPTALVVRDGEPGRVPVAEVVTGDLVLLAAGDLVPADGRLAEAHRMAVDEAALTGESVPVEHAAADELTAGTAVVRAEGSWWCRRRVTRPGWDGWPGWSARRPRPGPTCSAVRRG